MAHSTHERSHLLSAAEREAGLASFMRHITWNGLGVFLLNNTVVSLMAIHFAATNLELGYINAAFHVTGLVSLLVPRLFRGRRIVTLFGWAWIIRGFVAVGYGLLLFLSGPRARLAILILFTAFSVSRAVGVSVAHAVQREVMRDREMGSTIVNLNQRLGYSQLAAQLLGFLLLSVGFFSGIHGLVVIAYLGVIMNTVASIHILRIPGRSVVEAGRGEDPFGAFLSAMRHRNRGIPMVVHCLGMGVNVLLAFQVVFMRRVLLVPNSMAVLFTLLGAAGAIVSSMVLRPFADEVGEKPLLIISCGGVVVCSLVWTFIPTTLAMPLYYLLGFCTFFFLRALMTLKGTALIRAIPERNAVGYTSAGNMLLGAVALVMGLAGGALADITPGAGAGMVAGSPAGTGMLHQYSYTFLFTGAMALATMVFSAALPRGRSLSLMETGRIMLSLRNLRAFIDGNQLNLTVDPAQRESILLSLERSPTPIATSRLAQRLRSPSVAEKERVLRILFRSPREELFPEILAEAEDPGSYTRREAIFTLGAYPREESRALLRRILQEADYHTTDEQTAVVLKSLARLECRDTLQEIRRRRDHHLSPREELDLAVAEALLDPPGPQGQQVFQRIYARNSRRYAATLLLITLDALDCNPGLRGYLARETSSPGLGYRDLIEDAAEYRVIQTRRSALMELVDRQDYQGVWHEVAAIMEHITEGDTGLENVRRSVGAAGPPPAEVAPVCSLAALYVLYHSL